MASPAFKITALATGFVMAAVDTTVMQVAGPTIQHDLHTGLTPLTWAVDGYVLAFAALLMLAGGLSARFGARRVYLGGMAVFFTASLLAALAPGIGFLVGARLLQGAGAALFMPSSLGLLIEAFPDPRERTRVLGLWSAIVSSSVAFGPTLGGVLVSAFGWPSIFLVNLPIGLAGMALTRRCIAPSAGRPAPLAVPGHLLVVLGLAALSLTLIEGPHRGWTSPPVALAAAVTAASALLLLARERRATTTVMPWALFGRPRFTGANLVGFLFNAAFFGILFLLALHFQHSRGASPLRAGLELLPLTLVLPLSNLLYARVSTRFANGPLITIALLLASAASFTLLVVTPYWAIALALAVTGVAGGIISPAMTATLVDAAGPEHGHTAGSVLNTNRQIGSLIGIAAIGALLAASPDWPTGAALSFALIGAAYAAAALTAWRLILRPERRPAPAARLAAPAPATPTPSGSSASPVTCPPSSAAS
ncbi:MFS transporter [Actinomadura macrotermitis]|uniref:Multidrug resistance protein Stp n=1 Tax=Actinomadura macrotermitis TaxID=2585200 RepID=A0A7K0C4K5_9ACTN|nr:MFS transporter [Actinomadura macrotermitis]MQY08365.1 Multidrug resistance protein Stp [Actinomadura macrotermitis]